MLNIGQHNQLKVLEIRAHGAILDGGDRGRLLLPQLQCPDALSPGDELDVFIYLDAEGDPVPTTQRPAAEFGQVAWLEVVDVTSLGAFVDWGLPKDLFIPFGEQQQELTKGRHTLVRVYQDNQGRLAGSTRIDHWIKDSSQDLKQGEKVSLCDRRSNGIGLQSNYQPSMLGPALCQ